MADSPQIVRSGSQLRELLRRRRLANQIIGLVPTMGALHQGHLSLVRASQSLCQCTVVTIFVNPTQFAAGEDLERYPRTWDEDLRALEQDQVDVVFAPTADEIYPPGFSTYVEAPQVARRWEGELRATHFRGVATVVLKLFHLAPADWAFFGQKDYQQFAVIRRMVEDLNVPIRLRMCPIVREPDGLAMSSRNRNLSAEQRHRGLSLFQALRAAEQQIRGGQARVEAIEQAMRDAMEQRVDSIDYAAVVDADTLEPLSTLREPWVALLAARLGSTRLIDNMTNDELSASASSD